MVLSLPEDMLDDEVDDKDAVVFPKASVGTNPADLAQIQALIDASERPVVVAAVRFAPLPARPRSTASPRRSAFPLP